MAYFLLVTIVLFGYLSAIYGQPPATLQFVNLLYRHGARSPIKALPKHDIPVERWPQKTYGWLTQNGMRQHYELGKFIRRRYDGFLSPEYLHSETLIWSSDVFRTYQSAYCNLHGMYDPPTGENVWSPNRTDENWQPIPVMSIGLKAEDRYIRMSENCPNVQKLIDENYERPEAKKIMTDNKALFDYVGESVGLNLTYDNFWQVTDVLDCQEAQGFSLPAWANQTMYKKLKSLENTQFGDLFRGSKLKRLRGGPLLQQMIQHMHEFKKNTFSAGTKMRIYSGHDTTVAAVLTAMDMFNDIQPYYASALFIELHKDIAGDFVKVFYKDYTTDAAMSEYTNKISGCEKRCTFDQFVQEMSDGIPGDWEEECGLKDMTTISGSSGHNNSWTVVAAVTSTLIMLLR